MFVDAGYVIAEGAKGFVAVSASRGDVLLDVETLMDRLGRRATEASASPDERQVKNTVAAFAGTWAARATREELAELLAARPAVPAALVAGLLRAVRAVHGNLRGRDALRRAARGGFWEEISRAGHIRSGH